MPGANIPKKPMGSVKKTPTLAETKAKAAAASSMPKAKPASKELVHVPKKPVAPTQLSKLAKLGKFAAKKSVWGTAAIMAAEPIINAINKATKDSPKMEVKGSQVGRGGRPVLGPVKKSVVAKTGAPGAPGAMNKSALKSGGKYRVEHGDTLSGIAAKAGVTLAELRAANPQLKGKGIFRNTGVNIPKKGKKPSGGYTGPTPYRPGSAAAKAYEAARAKRK